jgi:hypothetical protein
MRMFTTVPRSRELCGTETRSTERIDFNLICTYSICDAIMGIEYSSGAMSAMGTNNSISRAYHVSV